MRFFYTLIASGLLILTEIPAEQPPPTVPYYAQVYSGSPSTYQVIPEYATRNEGNEDNYEARQLPAVKANGPEDGSSLIPVDYKISPNPPATTAIAQNVSVTYGQPSDLPITGYATYYNPNVMQQVLSNRFSMGQISSCSECVGTVALLRAGDINRRVWLQWGDGTVEGPFLVVDAAASQHVNMLLARHWVVDVDNRTAVRHGMRGPVWVTVWGAPSEQSQVASLPLLQLSYSIPVDDRSDTQAQLPVETPEPAATRPTLIVATPAAVTAVIHGGFPTETPVPTITPLPPINNTPSPTPSPPTPPSPTPYLPPPTVANTATNTPTVPPTATPVPATEVPTPVMVTVVIGGVPTKAVAPTITPLPPINNAPSPTTTSTQGIPTVAPTSTPVPTTTLLPAATALPAINTSTPGGTVVIRGGFPTEAAVTPTITPLPPINLTPAGAAVAVVATPTATATPTPAPTQTVAPTYTSTQLPSPVASATSAVVHGGFPTETLVPTITPLPAINQQATPTP